MCYTIDLYLPQCLRLIFGFLLSCSLVSAGSLSGSAPGYQTTCIAYDISTCNRYTTAPWHVPPPIGFLFFLSPDQNKVLPMRQYQEIRHVCRHVLVVPRSWHSLPVGLQLERNRGSMILLC
ncbi:hypothetical protein F4809DRAFT_588779 [Biscogniauxia mediterranea]|nr:hypothetical protein F4809DRAFT_588779 [Biscogniauxia mediterranea]